MVRQKKIDLLMKVFFLLNAVRNACLFLSIDTMASMVFYISYITLAALVGISALNIVRSPVKKNLYLIMSLFLMILLIAIPASYGMFVWESNSYTPLSFLLTMTFLICSWKLNISITTIKFCYATFVAQSLLAIICAFFPDSYEYGALVLHFGNPNQTAILLWSFFAFCFLYWTKKHNQKRKSLILWCLMICLMVMIYMTESRTALISCATCIVCYFVTKRKQLPNWIQCIIILAPISIPFIILYLYNILPSGFSILGKGLFSGRERIWKNVIDAFVNSPFSTHLDESPYYSYITQGGIKTLKAWGCHNGILAVQWNYGIITTILVIIVFLTQLLDLRKKAAINVNSRIAYVVVLATYISISFEEGILMGNVCTTIILPMLLLIGRNEYLAEVEIEEE